MKKLLETLYVLTPDSYLYERNDNICLSIGGNEKASVPASQVESIVIFGKNTVSTHLLGLCAEHGITVSFLDRNGRFLSRACGPVNGNVLLRKRQYAAMEDTEHVLLLVRDLLYGKLRNSKEVLLRHARNEEDGQSLYQAAEQLAALAKQMEGCTNVDSLRGIEGIAASTYFEQFDRLLSESCGFRFGQRSRKPPKNEVNAVLSFLYTMLVHDMRSALETVGLDPAAGYLHALRPGRPSLALDMMEELRAPLCDRMTLTLFNKGQLSKNDFEHVSQAVYLNDAGRKKVLSQWRSRKQEQIVHPFLKERIPIGLIPYAQSMLFARVLRGDLDRYPPFLWR